MLKMPGDGWKKSMPFLVVALLIAAVGVTGAFGTYSDEVAYKMFLERYFINGGVKQSMTAFCPDGFLTAPGAVLVPAAAIWAQLVHLGSSWLSYRFIPYLGLLAVFLTLIRHNVRKGSRDFWPLLLLVTLGPALFSLTMLRPEIIMLAASMGFFFLGTRMLASRRAAYLFLYAALSLLLYSLVAYVHPKELYLITVPVAALLLSAPQIVSRWQRYTYIALFMAGFLLATEAALALHEKQFVSCDSLPHIQSLMGVQDINPLDLFSHPLRFIAGLKLTFGKEALLNTYHRMAYQSEYQGQYLPGKPALSPPNLLINKLIILAVAGFIFYIATKCFRCFMEIKNSEEKKELCLIAAVMVALTAPFVLNITKAFYEVGFFVASLMVMATLLWPLKPHLRDGERKTSFALAALTVLSLVCILMSYHNFVPALLDGFRGPDLQSGLDRIALGQKIQGMMADAAIPPSEPLVVSDLTYEAVKDHPRAMPITYVPQAFGDEVGATEAYTRSYMERFGFRYGVTECSLANSITGTNFPVQILKTIHYTQSLHGRAPTVFDICLFRMDWKK